MSASNQTVGGAAAARWFDDRGLDAPRACNWYVEIAVESGNPDIWFEIDIYPEEWGFVFQQGTRISSIRVGETPFVHGRDDHELLAHVPTLERIGQLLTQLESQFNLTFHWSRAVVRSNLIRGTAIVRAWLMTNQ